METIEKARHQPYALGAYDCFWLACETEAALLGSESRWREWRGKYTTTLEAIALLNDRGGMIAAFDWFFGAPHIAVLYARRGDILLYKDRAGMGHLGVCVGASVAMYSEQGITFMPSRECRLGWRIGE